MTTLAEYANQHFPSHRAYDGAGFIELAPYTAVAHVVGRSSGAAVEQGVRNVAEGRRLSTEVVSLVLEPSPRVDREGIVDLSRHRLLLESLASGIVVGLIMSAVLAIALEGALASWILGAFLGVLAAIVVSTVRGGARYGGERAWEQPNAPDRSIVIVAAPLASEDDATDIARVMSSYATDDVRIVDESGAWHSPGT